MGFKPWRNLSVLLLAGVALVGCTTAPQKDTRVINTPNGRPPVGQANQAPAQFPGNVQPAGGKQNSQLVNQQKPVVPTFTPSAGQVPSNPSFQPQGNTGGIPLPAFPPSGGGNGQSSLITPPNNPIAPSVNPPAQNSNFGSSYQTAPGGAGTPIQPPNEFKQ